MYKGHHNHYCYFRSHKRYRSYKIGSSSCLTHHHHHYNHHHSSASNLIAEAAVVFCFPQKKHQPPNNASENHPRSTQIASQHRDRECEQRKASDETALIQTASLSLSLPQQRKTIYRVRTSLRLLLLQYGGRWELLIQEV